MIVTIKLLIYNSFIIHSFNYIFTFFSNFYWSLKNDYQLTHSFTLLDNEQISKNDTYHITDRRRNMQK